MTRVKPEFRDQVMSMWNADKTSGEIAAALHITRNAVIGIVQRFKGEKRKTTSTVILARQRAPRQPKPWTPPKSKRRQEPVVAPLVAAPAPMPVPAPLPTPPKPPAAPRLGRPCNIVDINSGCRWPIKEDQHTYGGYLFCNSQCSGTSPYCADHARQAGAVYSAKLIASTIAGARHAYKRQS